MFLREDAFTSKADVRTSAIRARRHLIKFANDPQWGVHAYPELYAKHHPELTAEYEQVRGQCRVVAWLAHSQLRAWEGVSQWVVERLQGFLLY